MRIARILPALLLGALAVSAPASAAPTVTEFDGLSAPGAGIAAADGALWVTQTSNPGRIARLGTDGVLLEYTGNRAPGLRKDRKPTAIAGSADGSLWFVEEGGDRVAHMTTTGVVSEFDLPGSNPIDVAVDAAGNAWVTEQGGSGRIVRVLPDGTMTSFTSGLTANSGPAQIALGADGAMWFTETATPGRIGRITADGTITERASGLTGGRLPADLAAAEGSIWFTATGSGGALGNLTGVLSGLTDPLLGGLLGELLGGSAPAAALAAGPDGAIWLTGAGSIGRFVPGDSAITWYTAGITSSAVGNAITTGPDGAIWFTEPDQGVVGRITVPPVALAQGTSAVTDTTAVVSGSVRPNGSATDYEIVVRDGGGSVVATSAAGAAGAGAAAMPVAYSVTGLSPSTGYRAQIVATNSAGTSESAELSFTTAAPAPPVVTPTPKPTPTPSPTATATPADGDATAQEDPGPAATDAGAGDPATDADTNDGERVAATPLPVLGRSIVVRAEGGSVRVKAPGAGQRYVELDATAAMPVGAIVDTRGGSIRLDTALDGAGRTQAAHFRGGLFRVRQAGDGGGMTDIVLAGGLDCRRRGATTASASAARKPRVRRLWARDRGGRYRTHGRDSVATVRGTSWLTEDRCDGTLTRVKSGAVSVRDRASGRSVLVRAGGRHLAPRS